MGATVLQGEERKMVGTGASGDVESARDTGFIGFDGVHIFNDVNSVNGVIYVYVGYQL